MRTIRHETHRRRRRHDVRSSGRKTERRRYPTLTALCNYMNCDRARKAVAALAMLSLVSACDDRPAKPILQITAGKGNAGISITNREPAAVRNCQVRLLDEGPDEWVAEVPGTIKPMQTVDIRWPAFRASDQPMPAYVGQNRTHFIVDCTRDDTDDRLSAGLSF